MEIRTIWPDREAGLKPHSIWCRAGELHLPDHVAWMGKYNQDGWGVYVGINARKKSGGKKAELVLLARCLFADFDKGETIEGARRNIRDSGLPEPTVLVNSGHGVHTYWRLATPITDLDQWQRRQKALIALLGSDASINDAPRVMRVPGFTNTKPPPAPCVLIEAHDVRVYDVSAFPALMPEVPVLPPPAVPMSVSLDDGAILRLARSATNGPKFEKIWAGNFDGYASKSEADMALCAIIAFYTGPDAARIERIVRGSGLSCEKWNKRKDYLPRTIAKVLQGKTEFFSPTPRETTIPQHLQLGSPEVTAANQTDPPAVGEQPQPDPEDEFEIPGLIPLGQKHKSGRRVLSPARTLPTAKAFIEEFFTHPDGRILNHFAGQFVEWKGNRYVAIEDLAVKQLLQRWLHRGLRYVLVAKEWELAPFLSNPATINAAFDSIRNFTQVPVDTKVPRWLDDTGRAPAIEFLPCKTMTLHVPTGLVIPATPLLFTPSALEFDHDPHAPAPTEWLRFLDQLFGRDTQSIQLLQEWFGYCLIADTSLQKMLLMVGPRRSGKGTIGRVLKELIGPGNFVGPTTSSLEGQFGLQPLIGKSLAVVSDARFSGKGLPIVVERLLCISGEDTLSIDRKFLISISMKLSTRFMFLTNELPRFTDSSSALVGRFLVLILTKSFYGEEDSTLTDRLIAELPGILNWALEGLKRLRERGRFVQPASGAEAIHELEELSSPASAFVSECCRVGLGLRVSVDELFAVWKRWCEQEGREPGNRQMFGRNLTSACPEVRRRRGTEGAFYEGIKVKELYL